MLIKKKNIYLQLFIKLPLKYSLKVLYLEI